MGYLEVNSPWWQWVDNGADGGKPTINPPVSSTLFGSMFIWRKGHNSPFGAVVKTNQEKQLLEKHTTSFEEEIPIHNIPHSIPVVFPWYPHYQPFLTAYTHHFNNPNCHRSRHWLKDDRKIAQPQPGPEVRIGVNVEESLATAGWSSVRSPYASNGYVNLLYRKAIFFWQTEDLDVGWWMSESG